MLDPKKDGSAAVKWFFPTGDRKLADWAGGVIGSVAVNDAYDPWGRRPRLAAFMAIDGNLYVVAQDALAGGKVPGPNLDGPYPTPELVAQFSVGRRHLHADHGGRHHRRGRLRQHASTSTP